MRLCCPQAAWCCGDLLIVSVVVIAKNTRVAKIMNKLRNFAISREFPDIKIVYCNLCSACYFDNGAEEEYGIVILRKLYFC